MRFILVLALVVFGVAVDASQKHGKPHGYLDFYAHPHYTFDYVVDDPYSGDQKKHWESRDGDQVKGEYRVVEPDGSIRIVEYIADDTTGFHAFVKKTPSVHPKVHSKDNSHEGRSYYLSEASAYSQPQVAEAPEPQQATAPRTNFPPVRPVVHIPPIIRFGEYGYSSPDKSYY